MKLQVNFIDSCNGRVLMLCDESGEPLPGQRSVAIRQELDAVTVVTVEFRIGRNVKMGAD